MIPLPRPYGILIVFYAVCVHYAWAGMLYFDNSASWATPIAPVWHLFHEYTAHALALFATLALASLFMRDRTPRVMFLIPQQFVMMLSAGGCIVAVWSGQYADGVVHPRLFIAADQFTAILFPALHAVAMMQIVMRVR